MYHYEPMALCCHLLAGAVHAIGALEECAQQTPISSAEVNQILDSIFHL